MKASELNKILERHQLWIETNGVQGERADLRGAYLRDANLTDADLEGANLFRAILEGANLIDANLNHAKLYYTNLRGADLTRAKLWSANLYGANLYGADLRAANLGSAYLNSANLTGAKDLPDISWIIPGCLVQLNQISYGFYLKKEDKYENFVQDSIGFFIQNNGEEGTFDMLLGDRIIRSIPDWVKYSGLKKLDP